jgi:hypothetical protein
MGCATSAINRSISRSKFRGLLRDLLHTAQRALVVTLGGCWTDRRESDPEGHMRDASCRKEDIIAAFEDLCRRLEERRSSLWTSYGDATKDLSTREYADVERECWHVLEAGLAGVEAERRMLQRDFEQRLAMLDEAGAVA